MHNARTVLLFPAMQVGTHSQVLEEQKLDVPILPMELQHLFSGSDYAHK